MKRGSALTCADVGSEKKRVTLLKLSVYTVLDSDKVSTRLNLRRWRRLTEKAKVND